MTEQELRADLEKLKVDFHEASQTQPASELAKLSVKIKAKDAEILALLSQGADVCKKCGSVPVAMLRTPAHIKRRIIDGRTFETPVASLYDVGCCGKRGLGETPQAAVKDWNEQNAQR